MGFEPREYRRTMRPEGLAGFRVVVAETDLFIHAEADLTDIAIAVVRSLRDDLEGYLRTHPRFGESFVPVPIEGSAPPIVREMAQAAQIAGVGPMAAVAGAFAEAVARSLEPRSAEVIVENGGDVYLMGSEARVVGLWADADAPRVGLRIAGDALPCAVATSSGTIGPSVSLGRADAATVIADSGALADAAASVVGNRVHGPGDLDDALAAGRGIEGVTGIVALVDGHLAAWGGVELVPLSDTCP